MTKEQVELFLASPEAEAVFVLAAFTIGKTPTTQDDELIDNIADYVEIFADKIKLIAASEPTEKDAKRAAVVILEKIASLTNTKYDDIIVAIAKKLL